MRKYPPFSLASSASIFRFLKTSDQNTSAMCLLTLMAMRYQWKVTQCPHFQPPLCFRSSLHAVRLFIESLCPPDLVTASH